ncbi:MAG: dihydrolipoamide acetyltransferase family protein [Candidatus Micrarchaeia archaeon]
MKELKFVDVGEGITEGHIQKWLVKDGDIVKEDQQIVQIETDKAVVNIPAPISGVIKINIAENSDVHIGDVLAYIGTADEFKGKFTKPAENIINIKEQASKIINQTQERAKNIDIINKTPQPSMQNVKSDIIATPSVRKLARSMNIDISKVVGSGPNGRILESDIKNFSLKSSTTPTQTSTSSSLSSISSIKNESDNLIERIPMSQTRKAIARNMEESWKMPRAVHMDKINATALWNIVMREKPNLEKDRGIKLTFLPFIIKATIEALKENPNFNASYDRDNQMIIRKKYYNIGLAAESPDGLKVAVVKNADNKSIANIAAEIQELHNKTLNNTITLDEMKDSTFTITNIGSLGGGYFSVPMINPPNVAILGIHLIRDEPVVVDGKIQIGKVLPFSLSFDHRVVDGAEAVLFGNAIIKYLEDPDFLEML